MGKLAPKVTGEVYAVTVPDTSSGLSGHLLLKEKASRADSLSASVCRGEGGTEQDGTGVEACYYEKALS